MKWYGWLFIALIILVIIILEQTILRVPPVPAVDHSTYTVPIHFMNHVEAKLSVPDITV